MADHAKEKQIPLVLIAIGLALYVVAAFAYAGANAVLPVFAMVLLGAIHRTYPSRMNSVRFIVAHKTDSVSSF